MRIWGCADLQMCEYADEQVYRNSLKKAIDTFATYYYDLVYKKIILEGLSYKNLLFILATATKSSCHQFVHYPSITC